MSPIQTAGVRGYADWQRVENWDSPLLYQVSRGATANSETTPVLDVSRFAYISGTDGVSTEQANVGFVWYADAAGTVVVGTRSFSLTPNIAQRAQYRLPNLGPFLQVGWTGRAGNNFGHVAQLFGTNRYHPLEFIPVAPLLISNANTPIGAGATALVYPASYYAGPVNCVFTSLTGVAQFIALAVDNAGSTVDLTQLVTPAAGALSQLSFIVPAGIWLMQVSNGGAATNYYLTCTPTLTGAS